MKLVDDKYCYACGHKNQNGLKLAFTISNDNIIYTEFTPQKHHQGFKDIVHGGIIGLILDEVMVNLPWKLGKSVVSVELNIRLKKMAKTGQKLIFKAWIEKEAAKLIYTKAEALNENKEIIAIASAKCMKVEG